MIVMAVDPGKSTGIVVAEQTKEYEYNILHYAQQSHDTFIETVAWLNRELDNWNVHMVITEQFDLRPHNKFLADITPIKVNSVLEYICITEGIMLKTQTPAQVKHLVKDQVLKNLGWWLTGKQVGCPDADDVRDAFRHLVHYAVFYKKSKPLSHAGWPAG